MNIVHRRGNSFNSKILILGDGDEGEDTIVVTNLSHLNPIFKMKPPYLNNLNLKETQLNLPFFHQTFLRWSQLRTMPSKTYLDFLLLNPNLNLIDLYHELNT